MGQHRFLFIGGCRDGEWINLNRIDMPTVVMPVPSPLVFEVAAPGHFLETRRDVYHCRLITCTGWKIFFRAYLLEGLRPSALAGGTLLPGGIVGQRPDAWDISLGRELNGWADRLGERQEGEE